MKFKSDIELQSGLRDGSNDIGTAGQILSSTGSQTNWIDQDSIVASEAKLVVIECKNTSGVTISKGTPVYQTGTVGATDVIEVDVADASDEDKMAAIGLLQTDIANNAFGKVVITGELLNITTSPIDGVTPVTGDTIYVKSGGGLTLTKPTGVNFIQNIGLVGKVSGGNSGSITVSSIMRSNDVPTPLYIDHTNQRLGIGTTSPSAPLSLGNGGAESLELNHNISSSSRILSYNRSNNTYRQLQLDAFEHVFKTSSSERMRITSAGRVGIGTTNPNVKLEILQGGTNEFPTLGTADGNLYLTDGGLWGMFMGVDSSSGTGWIQQMRNDSAVAYDISLNPVGGNVGIGTTSPSKKLEVNGTFKATGDASIDGTGNLSIRNQSATGSGIVFIDNVWQGGIEHISGNLYFRAGGQVDRMTIKTGGNVGIGTTSPSSKLHINTGAVYEVGSLSGSILIEPTGVAYNGYGAGIVLGAGRGGRASGGSAIASVLDSASDPDRSGLSFFYHNATFADPRTEGMRLNADGNVGIGTTSPSEKLHVVGTGSFTGQVTIPATPIASTDAASKGYVDAQVGSADTLSEVLALGNTTGGTNIDVSPNDVIDFFTGSNLNYGRIHANSEGLNLNTVANRHMIFSKGGTETMRINTLGNVGIGTTSPLGKLHILKGAGNTYPTPSTRANLLILENRNGSGQDSGMTIFTDNGGTGNIYFGDEQSNQVAGISCDNTNGKTELFFTTNGNNERLRIAGDGNVGIGTTSPSAKLNVTNGNILVDGSGIRQISLESSNDEVRFGLKGNNGNQFRIISDGTHFKLNDATKERIKITNAGDITFSGRDASSNQATYVTIKDTNRQRRYWYY